MTEEDTIEKLYSFSSFYKLEDNADSKYLSMPLTRQVKGEGQTLRVQPLEDLVQNFRMKEIK